MQTRTKWFIALALTILVNAGIVAAQEASSSVSSSSSLSVASMSIAGDAGVGNNLNVGNQLHLGNTARYMIDDGTYWTLNTGMNFAGNVIMNQYGSGEGGYSTVRTGTVGLKTNPQFTMGRITNAGVNLPEWRLMYDDDQQTERAAFQVEGPSGTCASVGDGARGSHFEAFVTDGDTEPVFRLNSYPNMRLQMGAGGSSAVDVEVIRSGTNEITIATNSVTRAVIDANNSTFSNQLSAVGDAGVLNNMQVGNRLGVSGIAQLASVDAGAVLATSLASAGSLTIAGGFTGATSATMGGTVNLSGSTLQLSAAAPSVFHSSTGTLTIESAAADATTSSSVPAIKIKADTNVTDGDLIFCVAPSTGTCGFSVNEQGLVNVSSNSQSCTLNGGTPSTCTVTVTAGAKCQCTPVGGTAVIAAAGCAVSLSSTTLTATSGATLSNDVNIFCDK